MYFNRNYFVIEKGAQLDLWSPKIEWHDCPKELAQSIILVQHARSFDGNDVYLQYVHVAGKQVVACDGSIMSRSWLPKSVPFEMAINPGVIKDSFNDSRHSFFCDMDYHNRVLTRLAKVEIGGLKGIAWDFGDHRAWCVSESTSPTRKIIQDICIFLEDEVIDIVEEVSDDVRDMVEHFKEIALEIFHSGYPDHSLTVEISNGKFHVAMEEENKIIRDEHPFMSYWPVEAVTFKANANQFFHAINRKSSMAILRNKIKNIDFLYFKESEYDCEHLIECEIKQLILQGGSTNRFYR